MNQSTTQEARRPGVVVVGLAVVVDVVVVRIHIEKNVGIVEGLEVAVPKYKAAIRIYGEAEAKIGRARR